MTVNKVPEYEDLNASFNNRLQKNNNEVIDNQRLRNALIKKRIETIGKISEGY